MKYTKPDDLNAIRLAFKSFLSLRGYSFRSFCLNNKLDYFKQYRLIFIGNIIVDEINRLIKLVDTHYRLSEFRGKFQIVKI
jgi:hypothetical protein